MSASGRADGGDRPESAVAPALAAFAELDRMVRHLGEELAFFRRRALDAERRVRELSASAAASAAPATPSVGATAGMASDASQAAEPDPALTARVAELEAENADLRARLAEAATRTRAITERMRFLRQQQEAVDER